MGDIPEPRTKIWVSRDRTVQIHEFEPVKFSAGIQQAFEILRTGKEISDWMHEMESVVMESLDRQEASERLRKTETVDVPKSEIVEKKTEQKTLGKIENKKEKKDKLTPLVSGRVGEWTPTKNPNIEMKKTSDGGLDFHDIKTGEFWHRLPKNSPK